MPFTCCVLALNGVNQDCSKAALQKKQEVMMSRGILCLFKAVILCQCWLQNPS